jgi:hypothetical protein
MGAPVLSRSALMRIPDWEELNPRSNPRDDQEDEVAAAAAAAAAPPPPSDHEPNKRVETKVAVSDLQKQRDKRS